MTWTISLDYDSYQEAVTEFEWDLPADYNLATDLVAKHPNEKVAMISGSSTAIGEEHTFGELDRISDQFSNALQSSGVEAGDRIAVVADQRMVTPITHLAAWKLGAISVPLSTLHGKDAIHHRLIDSGSKAVIVEESSFDVVGDVAPDCPDLEIVIGVDGAINHISTAQTGRFESMIADQSGEGFNVVRSGPETPAIIIYTSGTTGKPKGVLLPHGVWTGSCASFVMSYDRDVRDQVFWTPAQWAWMGGMGNVLFPAWHYGQPVVAYPRTSFDARKIFEILETYGVTKTFIPPTALRMLRNASKRPSNYEIELETIASGGEAVTADVIEWVRTAFDDVSLNEVYGQTEANVFIASCADWFEKRADAIGKPVPGHDVTILDPATGTRKPAGERGEIAIRRDDDPMVFLRYWNRPDETVEVTRDGWHLTGDIGVENDDGSVTYVSRADDLIITSGYRVAPGEVETALRKHELVKDVGVVGVPESTRGEVIAAFVVLADDSNESSAVKEELRSMVRDSLAKYAYPRVIKFVEELPMTTTGKVDRTALPTDRVD